MKDSKSLSRMFSFSSFQFPVSTLNESGCLTLTSTVVAAARTTPSHQDLVRGRIIRGQSKFYWTMIDVDKVHLSSQQRFQIPSSIMGMNLLTFDILGFCIAALADPTFPGFECENAWLQRPHLAPCRRVSPRIHLEPGTKRPRTITQHDGLGKVNIHKTPVFPRISELSMLHPTGSSINLVVEAPMWCAA